MGWKSSLEKRKRTDYSLPWTLSYLSPGLYTFSVQESQQLALNTTNTKYSCSTTLSLITMWQSRPSTLTGSQHRAYRKSTVRAVACWRNGFTKKRGKSPIKSRVPTIPQHAVRLRDYAFLLGAGIWVRQGVWLRQSQKLTGPFSLDLRAALYFAHHYYCNKWVEVYFRRWTPVEE